MEKTIYLWENEIPNYDKIIQSFSDRIRSKLKIKDLREIPKLDLYLLNDVGATAPLMIICMGGGYNHRADHEGKPVALWLNDLGYHAVVLQYRVAPYYEPTPLLDALRSVLLVRKNAKLWRVDRNKIGMLGFSAGGHLTSSVGVHYDYIHPSIDRSLVADMENPCRPDLLVLCYAVINTTKYINKGSFKNLLGKEITQKLLDFYSSDQFINSNTPPSFLWHTKDDGSVPYENSLLFHEGLKKHNVETELRLFEHGRHGLGLSHENEDVAQWTGYCAKWLKKMGWN